ncbi:eCIS core domain-containing protein [Streptantibioticus parmotrematis]|nr:DUF4157 domain-containing protein [Streptantibioticus parmotrematis]
MQGSVGNAAVVQMLRQAGHAWARDAHQHGPGCGHSAQASQPQGSPASPVQRAVEEPAQRAVEEDEHAHGHVPDTSPEGQSALLAAARQSPSEPLPSSVVAKAEPFFQNDRLSSTRVHRDAVAQRATAALGAQAMTVGNHIFLSAAAVGDERILGHELSHVDKNTRNIRETGNDNGAGVTVTDPGQGSERAAEADGHAYATGMATAPSVGVQRTVATGADANVQRAVEPHGGVAVASHAAVANELAHGDQAVQRAGGHGAARSSTRRRRIHVSSLPHAVYIDPPSYGPTFGRGGGTQGHVILGPHGYSDRRSDADPRLPPAIDSARAEYPYERFKAGHLINASFGGDGTRSANLTILTTGANNEMRGFDEPVKKAMSYVEAVYERLSHMYEDITRLTFGVEVTVTPGGPGHTWDVEGPGKYISSYVHCKARVVGADRLDRWIDRGLDDDPRDPDWLAVRSELAMVDHYVERANRTDLIDNEPS